jgi:glycosyltransferase involved in cell wall biosynthesis
VPGNPQCSIVIPFYNEEDNVLPLLGELREVLQHQSRSYEILLIDDGSTDSTADRLRETTAHWPAARLVSLTPNCGQAAALITGIRLARGRAVVLLDGDGQNDPGDIERALELLTDFSMVVGCRVHRKDSLKRRVLSRLGNYVRRLFVDDGVSDAGCGLKAFRSEVAEAFIPIQTLYSFMPALAKAAGFTIGEIPVNPSIIFGCFFGVRLSICWEFGGFLTGAVPEPKFMLTPGANSGLKLKGRVGGVYDQSEAKPPATSSKRGACARRRTRYPRS